MTTPPRRCCRLFIFDLDGTLVDSRADLIVSLNLALTRLGYHKLPGATIAAFVGEGVHTLVKRALRAVTDAEPDAAAIEELVEFYLDDYSRNLLGETHLYHEAREALDALAGARFAVVTNKVERFARQILEGLGVADRFAIILGGDSVERCKPAPDALLRAMAFCQVRPEETAMIGDSLVDIEAGKAAGVSTCAILGGFRPDGELLTSGCDFILTSLLQLADHFDPR